MSASTPAAAADAPEAPAPRRRRRSRAVAVAAGVAVVVAGGWWATHADRLQPSGNGLELPVAAGESAVAGMFAEPRSGAVELVQVEPVVTENSSDAELRVLLCSVNPGQDVVGSARGRAEQVCDRTADPRGKTLQRLRDGGSQLVLEVVPRRPGQVVVEGLQVRYRSGLQRGEQVSGLRVTVTTPEHS